jgi:hypothetical protein
MHELLEELVGERVEQVEDFVHADSTAHSPLEDHLHDPFLV